MISRGYLLLSTVLLACLILRAKLQQPTFVEWSTLRARPRGLDPESQLARGTKLDLLSLDQFGVELIRGVGSDLSERIMERKRDILDRAKNLPCDEGHRALEVVHGIGEKTSEKLAAYLLVRNPAGCGTPLPTPTPKPRTKGKMSKDRKRTVPKNSETARPRRKKSTERPPKNRGSNKQSSTLGTKNPRHNRH